MSNPNSKLVIAPEPWMARIKPMSEEELKALSQFAREYPEKFYEREIIVVQVDEVSPVVHFHFTKIKTVTFTCLDDGEPRRSPTPGHVVFGVATLQGFCSADLYYSYTRLVEIYDVDNTALSDQVFIYAIINPPNLNLFARKKTSTQKLTTPQREIVLAATASQQRPARIFHMPYFNQVANNSFSFVWASITPVANLIKSYLLLNL